MEVWKDYQTGKYYSIDPSLGRQSPSNRFGGEKKAFTAYSTGFPHIIKAKDPVIEKMYTVQPQHFDGYCQFPRPPIKKSSISESPYVRRWIKSSKIHIKDPEKIPQPLNFLNMSQGRTASPRQSRSHLYRSLPAGDLNSIQDIKNSLVQPALKDLRTATDLTLKLEKEKKNSTGYIRPKSKILRRKLKGFFLKDFKTSGELFSQEKKIWESSNPELVKKRKKMEELDRKMLEKKCMATRLLMNS